MHFLSDSMPTKVSPTYEHIRVNGLPKERGLQYGEKAAAKIRCNIQNYLKPGQLPPWEKTLQYINDIYLPGMKQYFPAALEEMEGIAEGAGVSVEEIIMLNARYDLTRAPGGSLSRKNTTPNGSKPDDVSNECTSCAFWKGATADDIVYTAQSWDMSSHLYFNDLVIYLEVHPDPSEGIPSMFLVTEAGQLCRSGMNSAGLGLTANSLHSSRDYFPAEDEAKPMLPVSLLRRLYLQERCFPQALQAVYNAPRHVSNNLTLATAEGFALCLELTPHDAFIITPSATENHLIHANHFLSPVMSSHPDIRDSYLGGSSWFRPSQMQKGVQPYLDRRVDVNVITKAFSDHLGFPQALCTHVDTSGGTGIPGYPFKTGMTICCVVYDLTRKIITVCKGTPCQGLFESFRLD